MFEGDAWPGDIAPGPERYSNYIHSHPSFHHPAASTSRVWSYLASRSHSLSPQFNQFWKVKAMQADMNDEDDRLERKRRRRQKVVNFFKAVAAFSFSHIGLAGMVVAYTIMGGFIFRALEAPTEQQEKLKILAQRQSLIDQVWVLATRLDPVVCGSSLIGFASNPRGRGSNTSQPELVNGEEFNRTVRQIFLSFQHQVHTAIKEMGWDGNDDTDETALQWSLAGAILYAVTVITTIGYGHVAPKTIAGRLLTIIYALIGIPLTFLYLSNIGNFLADCFRLFYKRICCDIICCQKCYRQRKRDRLKSRRRREIIARWSTAGPDSWVSYLEQQHLPQQRMGDRMSSRSEADHNITSDDAMKCDLDSKKESRKDRSKIKLRFGGGSNFHSRLKLSETGGWPGGTNLGFELEDNNDKLCRRSFVDNNNRQSRTSSSSTVSLNNISDPVNTRFNQFKRDRLSSQKHNNSSRISNKKQKNKLDYHSSSGDISATERSMTSRNSSSDVSDNGGCHSGTRKMANFPETDIISDCSDDLDNLSLENKNDCLRRTLAYNPQIGPRSAPDTIYDESLPRNSHGGLMRQCDGLRQTQTTIPISRRDNRQPPQSLVRPSSRLVTFRDKHAEGNEPYSMTSLSQKPRKFDSRFQNYALKEYLDCEKGKQGNKNTSIDRTEPRSAALLNWKRIRDNRQLLIQRARSSSEPRKRNSDKKSGKDKDSYPALGTPRNPKQHLLRSMSTPTGRGTLARQASTAAVLRDFELTGSSEPKQKCKDSLSQAYIYDTPIMSSCGKHSFVSKVEADPIGCEMPTNSKRISRCMSEDSYQTAADEVENCSAQQDEKSQVKQYLEHSVRLERNAQMPNRQFGSFKVSTSEDDIPEPDDNRGFTKSDCMMYADSTEFREEVADWTADPSTCMAYLDDAFEYEEDEEQDEKVTVPVAICLVIIGGYLLAGSAMFAIWEGWDYVTGSYFCFVTLSTIGFGDIVPGTDMTQWAAHAKLVLCALWLAFGLSLLAMCFNLMQEEVKEKCKWIGQKLGLLKDDGPR